MPRPRPRSCSLRGASAAMVGRVGRCGANGLSAEGPARSSRNGLRGRAAGAGANGLALTLGGGAKGINSVLGGGANGLAPAEWSLEPADAATVDELEPAGSQLGRWALDPRSPSSQ